MFEASSWFSGVLRIGIALFALTLCSNLPASAQRADGIQVREQSDPGHADTSPPVLNERGNLIRTPEQQAEFDAYRQTLRRAAEVEIGHRTYEGRVRKPYSGPTTTQKVGATTVFTVTADFDNPDETPGNGVCYDGFENGGTPECTLRAAIQEANATAGTDPIVIRVDMISPDRGVGITEVVAYDSGNDLWTLFVNTDASIDSFSVLPPLTRSNVLIDATTQLDGSGIGDFDDAYCGQPAIGDTSIVKVAIDGSLLTGSDAVGLEILADNVEIRGLAVMNFPSVGIFASGSNGFKVDCSHLGTDHLARTANPNGTSGLTEQSGSGFRMTNSIASGNMVYGVRTSSDGSVIDSSFFGLDVTGLVDLGNDDTGVYGSGKNLSVKRIFASGNGNTGLWVTGDSADVTNSLFGLGFDSTTVVPNDAGIRLYGNDGRVGGPAGERVIASGNTSYGMLLTGGTSGNVIDGAMIGTNATGASAVPNGTGISDGGTGNFIGAEVIPPESGRPEAVLSKAARSSGVPSSGAWSNLISGNNTGILASSTSVILRNYIGTNSAGTAAVPNVAFGVQLQNGTNHEVGRSSGNGNLISGNGSSGIFVNETVTSTTIKGNYVGTNAAGTSALKNQLYGIFNQGSGTNIGGSTAGQGNVISGNGSGGVYDEGISTVYLGNKIGTNAAGDAKIANTGPGITRYGPNVVIGGNGTDDGNLISGNGGTGIWLLDLPPSADGPDENGMPGQAGKTHGTPGNNIYGNVIGAAIDSTTAMGNTGSGVWTNTTGVTLVGGGVKQGNVIAFNTGAGVRVENAGTTGIVENQIFGNGNLGIDLGGDGVTANDGGSPPDTDAGPNGLQNFPVIAGADLIDPDTVSVALDLASTPSTSFRVDYYRSDAADVSGYGEGAVWLKTVNASTDGNGDLALSQSFPLAQLPGGSWVTATATNTSFQTSEFSNAVQVGGSNISLSSAKVFLEGPYASGSMATTLLSNGYVPLDQPYSDPVFNGTLQEVDAATSVAVIPANTVDWVTLSLRTDTLQASEVGRRVAFLKQDGSLTNLDGGSSIEFVGIDSTDYFLVVCHRNHLCAMSASKIDFSSGSSSWDFTTAMTQAHSEGGAPLKALGDGKFGLFAADANVDSQITAPDFNSWNAGTTAGETGYRAPDHNLDGIVTAPDFNLWNANTTAGASSQVP